MVLRAI